MKNYIFLDINKKQKWNVITSIPYSRRLVQLVERWNLTPKVRGSSPLTPVARNSRPGLLAHWSGASN